MENKIKTAEKTCDKRNTVKGMIAFLTVIWLVFITVLPTLAQQQTSIKSFKPPAQVKAEDILQGVDDQEQI
jgi:competence protein ComGC